ncbi:hypothetical protein ACFYVR_25035 [Rhodococcus sp. NPDC003318]|uniref:hypothetical protein n=1 Tax=Rhodococcus sp. NPDC003318 TaxID=3364503 RepID=UPI003678260A
MRTATRILLLLLTTLLVSAVGGAAAWAQPAEPAATGKFPVGMPEDLKRFFTDSEEFKTAEWSTGKCADKGGDVGQYLYRAMQHESQLVYWSATREQRVQMVKQLDDVSDQEAEAAVHEGREPNNLPDTFPAGDQAYSPESTCAADLAKWATPDTSNQWGFTWTTTPDDASIQKMKGEQYVDKLPGDIFTNACAAGPLYCNKAFFLNCDQAVSGQENLLCQQWNTRIGKLFGGTANWVDQNTSFSDRFRTVLGSAVQKYDSAPFWLKVVLPGGASLAIVSELGGLANAAKFITDPASVIDDWANTFKSGAVSVSKSVLDGLANVGEFNPGDPEFLRWYAFSAGIGMLTMCLMTLLAIYKSSDGSRPPMDLAKDLFGYLPAGLVTMMFAPAMAQWLITLAHELTVGINSVLGESTEEAINNISTQLGEMTDKTVVGGALAGIIGFGLLFLGAMAMFFGLLMHAAALPVLAGFCGIAFGMWVHPKWRKKALRPVYLFIGLVFSKPLLFLAMGFIMGVINTASTSGVVPGELASLGSLSMIAVCFVILGLAPFSLLKYAPFTPTAEDSEDFGQSGSTSGQTVSSAVQTAQMVSSSSSSRHADAASSHSARTMASAGQSAASSSPSQGGGHAGSHVGGANAVGGHSGPAHSSALAGSGGAQKKLAGAVAGVGSTLATGGTAAVLVGATVGGAAMNKAATAAQNAPERSDMDGQ